MGDPGVLESVTFREVVSVFSTHATVNVAVDNLLLAGFDRSDIDVSAEGARLCRYTGGVPVPAVELAAKPDAPRAEYIAPEDTTFVIALFAAVFGCFGGMIGALATIAAGEGFAWAAAAAAILGLAGCGQGILVARYLGWRWTAPSAASPGTDGVVLFVRVRTPEQEGKALAIVRKHGGDAVRVHSIEIDKRLADLPLSSLRPDLWLSNEPLGAP